MDQERGPRGTSEGIPGLSEGTLAENLRGFQTPQWEPRLRDSEKPSDGETLVESPEKPFRGALQMPLLWKSPGWRPEMRGTSNSCQQADHEPSAPVGQAIGQTTKVTHRRTSVPGTMGQCRSANAEDAQEFSDVERAIETLIRNFHQYSVEGGKETLTPTELRDLVTQQLPHLMPSNCGLEEKIANLGNCNDSKLEFGSFWELIGEAAKSVKMESPVARS